MHSRCRAAIVDLDGTLVDTLGDFHAALAQAFTALGLRVLERERIERLVGKGSEHLIRSALAAVGAPPEHYPAAWDAYQASYRVLNGRHSALYPGAAEGVAALRGAGLRLACLTNKPTEFAQALLQAKGLAEDFEVVFGGDAFARRKPDPLPVLQTCARLGVLPAETLMVGDSSNDAQAARGAGCPVVLVTYGYNHGEPVRMVDADGFVDRITEVLPWLRRRAGGGT